MGNPMRAGAVVLCVMLLSATALAQGKGGPNPDPLGDKTHAETA